MKGGLPGLTLGEYIASVRRDPARLKAVSTCVSELLKSEEERGDATREGLREILAGLG